MTSFRKFIAAGFATAFCLFASPSVANYPDYSNKTGSELIALHEAGDAHASFTLGYDGLFSDTGLRDVEDPALYMHYLQQAHDAGHHDAFSVLSAIYTEGLFGVEKDVAKAQKLTSEAYANGSRIAALNVNLDVLSDIRDGDDGEAVSELTSLSESDDDIAMIAMESLALFYFNESKVSDEAAAPARAFSQDCVARFRSTDCAVILDLLRNPDDETADQARVDAMLADAGDPDAVWRQGLALIEAGDPAAAFAKIDQAAEMGSVNGMISRGVMLATGEGVEQDFEAAYASYELAAERGSPHAMRSMGAMNCAAEGRIIDEALCGALLLLAYRGGDEQANDLLAYFFDATTPQQIERLERGSIVLRRELAEQFGLVE